MCSGMVMQVVKNSMNRKPRTCDSRTQPMVNNAHSEQYCDSIDSICHKNCFEVLSVEDCVSDKYDPSVIVDLKGDSQRHISNTVSVKNRNKLKIKVGIQFIYSHKGPCRICFTNLNQKFQIMTVRIASNRHLLQRLAQILTSASLGTL